MESKGPYAPPPNYTDAMQPPSYQAAADNLPYPAGSPMGGPGVPTAPYPPQPAAAPIVVQTVYVQPRQLGFQPTQTTCASCNQLVLTRVVYSPGALTWLSCGGLFLVGCWLGCCLIPFCIDGLKDVEHFCPNCGANIGACRRL
ncbi:lipopolysaccharide-induced tumor necrosis factor-alpha factor homolog [Rhincodon typus]|uniref:lipopolysaccharide-induced tumor necrosis factor-alpha factor homolog n=1 Tax=Rhincodon typus TaxID=259920 RepID=UPI0009A42A87|nr:lipopolysaccharide-induced tumor necrosis factor-alpha factor homolog [Rhincodon typus]XP_048465775.1 lipopolysaccharide-induced tumor necrosis factor-alpha factor homolog [Rhincodon typus]